MTTQNPVGPPNDGTAPPPPEMNPLHFVQSYEKSAPRLEALADAQIHRNIRVGAMRMFRLATASASRVAPLRAALVEHCGKLDISNLDNLELYAHAHMHAHGQYIAASKPAESVEDLVAQMVESRETLVADVTALVKRKHLDGRVLGQLKGVLGYDNLIGDLMLLSRVVRDNWDKLTGKTLVTQAELDVADELCARLLTTVALRDGGKKSLSERSEMRLRTYSLLYSAYEEVRRAVAYLRWYEQDTETLIPSFFTFPGGRPGKSTDGEEPTENAEDDKGPTPQGGVTPAPAPPPAPPAGPPAPAKDSPFTG